MKKPSQNSPKTLYMWNHVYFLQDRNTVTQQTLALSSSQLITDLWRIFGRYRQSCWWKGRLTGRICHNADRWRLYRKGFWHSPDCHQRMTESYKHKQTVHKTSIWIWLRRGKNAVPTYTAMIPHKAKRPTWRMKGTTGHSSVIIIHPTPLQKNIGLMTDKNMTLMIHKLVPTYSGLTCSLRVTKQWPDEFACEETIQWGRSNPERWQK